MSYLLTAAIGPFDLLRETVPGELRLSVAPLEQRMGLVPLRPSPGEAVPLDGTEVMRILGIPAGPRVGAALRHIQNLRLTHPSLSRDDASTALRSWRAGNPAD